MKHILLPVYMILIFVLLAGCNNWDTTDKMLVSTMSVNQLIEIIEDPDSPLYLSAVDEITSRGESASEAAPALAQALRYPRRDSYLVGIALISMGPKAMAAIPYLIPALEDESVDVRAYASLSLGSIGQEAQCAIPQIAPLLWDMDPTVRASAASAIDSITNINLVDPAYKYDPAYPNSILQDYPEGLITSSAKTWWLDIGQYLDWKIKTENCNFPGE